MTTDLDKIKCGFGAVDNVVDKMLIKFCRKTFFKIDKRKCNLSLTATLARGNLKVRGLACAANKAQKGGESKCGAMFTFAGPVVLRAVLPRTVPCVNSR